MDNDGGKLLNEDNDLRSVCGFCSSKTSDNFFLFSYVCLKKYLGE